MASKIGSLSTCGVLLALIVLMVVNVQTPSRLQKFIVEVPPPPPEFEFYVFAQTWFPSFKKGNQHRKDLVDGFFIHGLWPSNCEGAHPRGESVEKNGFDSTNLGRLGSKLRRDWPNLYTATPAQEALPWITQWSRHGVCTGMKTFDYLRVTLDIFADKKIKEILGERGIRPQNGVLFEFSEIKKAIKDGIGVFPMLVCYNIGDSSYLLEVRLCLHLGDNNQPNYKNCVDTSTCRDSVYFPSS